MQELPGNQEYNLLMSRAYFFFLGRLNDFLPRDQREQNIKVEVNGEPAALVAGNWNVDTSQ